MTKTRWNWPIRYGALIVAASGLLWAGAEAAKRIEWILPYTAALGGLLIILGGIVELRTRKRPTDTEEGPARSAQE